MSKEIFDIIIIEDSYIPVPKFVTEWLGEYPEEVNEYEAVPDNIIKFLNSESGKTDKVFVSSGSWENDRALFIASYAPKTLGSIKELNKYFTDNGFSIGDELEYLSY